MTTKLFGRSWSLRIGNTVINDLDMEFTVFKSIKREPNKCSLRVFGMSETTRQRIETQLDYVTTNQRSTTTVDATESTPQINVTVNSRNTNLRAGRPWIELKAGYGDEPNTIFFGQVGDKGIVTEADSVDIVMLVEARDGGSSYQRSRINQSFAPGTSVESVLRAAVSALGIGEGNLNDFTTNLALTNGTTVFVTGYTASGPARETIDSIVRGAGLRWAIQNGILTIRKRGQPLQIQATQLSPDTGLIGSPTVDPRGVVTAQCLIQPGIDPGRKIHLKSRQFDGGYQVTSVTYTGNTSGQEWYATLTLQQY